MFRAPCAHHQEVNNLLYSIWYRHTCRWPSGVQVQWGDSPPSTCTPKMNASNPVHLVGFIVTICHDARSPERQMCFKQSVSVCLSVCTSHSRSNLANSRELLHCSDVHWPAVRHKNQSRRLQDVTEISPLPGINPRLLRHSVRHRDTILTELSESRFLVIYWSVRAFGNLR